MAATSPAQPVTRREVAALVAPAFGHGAVHRDAILAAARGAGARREVLEMLERLPAYRYVELRQIWEHLPGAPVG